MLHENEHFDLKTNEFTPPYNGLYWFHWSVSLQSESFIDISLVGGPRSPDIIKYASHSITDVSSRDEICMLQVNQTNLFLSSDFNPIDLYSSGGQEMSFSGFHMDSTMKPVIAFSFGRSAITSNSGRIPFDIVIVDTHAMWNSLQNAYTFPRKGTYVVTLIVATSTDTVSQSRIGLYIDFKLITGIHCGDKCTHTDGEITLSKTVIVKCKKKAQLYASLENSRSIYSDFRYHTALMGFMYSPREGIPIAWSVASSMNSKNIDQLSFVAFDYIFVNEGNGWNATNSCFITPESGVYYIHLAYGLFGTTTTLSDNFKVHLELLLNGLPYIWQSHLCLYNRCSALPVTSRAIILRLSVGDRLQIRLRSDYGQTSLAQYTSSYKMSTFSGFRIHF